MNDNDSLSNTSFRIAIIFNISSNITHVHTYLPKTFRNFEEILCRSITLFKLNNANDENIITTIGTAALCYVTIYKIVTQVI